MALPSGYTQLEYIQSSGTQYIDTGFGSTRGWVAELDWMFTVAPTSEQDIIGSVYISGGTYYREYVICRDNQWSLGHYSNYAYSGSAGANTRYSIKASTISGDGYLTVNGTQVHKFATTYSSHAAHNVYVFAMNVNGAEGFASGRLYSLKLYNQSNTLVRNYIPCKNVSGTIGLWDDANSKFYANAGTGTFTAGPAVVTQEPHNTNISGTAREIESGAVLLGGTAYEIEIGMTLVGGTAYEIEFGPQGTLVGNLAVGSSVYINVNGIRKEFIIVHQGNPDSSMYDGSCNGTWLLMKDIYENRQFHSDDVNQYQNSTIHTYLNNNFLNLFDSGVKELIKTVKIPYWTRYNSGWNTGANGLSTSVFLLSMYEVGSGGSGSKVDGAKLDYFEQVTTTSAKRVAYYNGVASDWWSRGLYSSGNTTTWCVGSDGWPFHDICSNKHGIRPAFILFPDACVDDNFDVIT